MVLMDDLKGHSQFTEQDSCPTQPLGAAIPLPKSNKTKQLSELFEKNHNKLAVKAAQAKIYHGIVKTSHINNIDGS